MHMFGIALNESPEAFQGEEGELTEKGFWSLMKSLALNLEATEDILRLAYQYRDAIAEERLVISLPEPSSEEASCSSS